MVRAWQSLDLGAAAALAWDLRVSQGWLWRRLGQGPAWASQTLLILTNALCSALLSSGNTILGAGKKPQRSLLSLTHDPILCGMSNKFNCLQRDLGKLACVWAMCPH